MRQERVFRSGQRVGEGAERRLVLGVGLPEQDPLGRRARGSRASAFLCFYWARGGAIGKRDRQEKRRGWVSDFDSLDLLKRW